MGQKMLFTLIFYKKIVRGILSNLMRQNIDYLLSYIFLEYLYHRLQKLFKQNLYWITLQDTALKHILLSSLENTQNEYIDYDSCALANIQLLKRSTNFWFYICSIVSMRKYKLRIIPANDISENIILISETMQHNLLNALHHEKLDESCFLLPSKDDTVEFASSAAISIIASPYKYADMSVDIMLENYFSYPRFFHVNDVFQINIKKYAPIEFYSSSSTTKPVIYFVVKSLKLDYGKQCYNVNDCYIVRGLSTLIQETKIHGYMPRKHLHLFPNKTFLQQNEKMGKLLNGEYPLALAESFEYLESCIIPFIKNDIQLNIKPIFLIKGSRGCGKHELVEILSKRMGLNILGIDFAEVQTETPAQTVAKLQTVLFNAQLCTPCILYLNNIQLFGQAADGQKDERIISAFSTHIAVLYNIRSKFPVIIIAASDETDLPAEMQRLFTETIHIKHLNQNKRVELLSWFLSNRNLKTTADLSKVASLCSDFKFADLLALSLHAAKLRYKFMPCYSKYSSILTQEDFDRAYEYMQSVYSDSKGAPCIPKIHWEDIGGLAELKHEITRRIQLPLLNAFGFGQSGLLLYGPPGTGKTLLAKAVATEYQLHFMSVKGPEVLNMYVGQSEKNVREIFQRARSAAPCIIFFDELDSLAPNRGRSGDSDGVMDRVVSQLLAEMDGLEESSSIFIVGATNRLDLIDPALLRPGRFDKMLYVGIYSDRASKLSVLEAQTRKFALREEGRELEQIVDQLPDNLTGADLYSISSNAWLNAVREFLSNYKETKETNKNFSLFMKEQNAVKNGIIVESYHFLDAIRNLTPSVSEKEIERYNRMRQQLSSS